VQLDDVEPDGGQRCFDLVARGIDEQADELRGPTLPRCRGELGGLRDRDVALRPRPQVEAEVVDQRRDRRRLRQAA
jgi:hypothetical protein